MNSLVVDMVDNLEVISMFHVAFMVVSNLGLAGRM